MPQMRASVSKMKPLEFIDKPLTIQEPPNFTVVSTFAGCGGSSTGYIWAGGKVLLAVEWDDNAVETYRLNYPNTPIYHGDIAQLSVEKCLEQTKLKVGELDILDGSPPCQGFSTAGKRVMEDPRNQLFQEYIRLLRGLKPKVFVMENVSGMVKGKMKLIFAEIMCELKASGYKVSARLLNAMYFGVPQSRERMIFIGIREDLGIEPSHPKAQNKPITSQEALMNAMPKTFGDYRNNPSAQKIKSMLHLVKQGRSMGDITKSNFSLCRLHPEQPAPTICKQITFSGIGNGILHYNENRQLSIEELKRIASYPDDYQFIGKFETQWERIGNSVPPMFMKAIADHIWSSILQPIKKSTI